MPFHHRYHTYCHNRQSALPSNKTSNAIILEEDEKNVFTCRKLKVLLLTKTTNPTNLILYLHEIILILFQIIHNTATAQKSAENTRYTKHIQYRFVTYFLEFRN